MRLGWVVCLAVLTSCGKKEEVAKPLKREPCWEIDPIVFDEGWPVAEFDATPRDGVIVITRKKDGAIEALVTSGNVVRVADSTARKGD